MYQRTLASIFLFTLLLAQAAEGLCQLRCDRKPSTRTSACHAMAMLSENPSVQAEAPCPTQSCPADHILPGTTQAFQPNLSISLNHQPIALSATTFGSHCASPIESPPRFSLLTQPKPPALPRLTSLRL